MDSARYGTTPAPPPLSAGTIPSQRLSTQIPQYNVAEAPACVQNAMMTKDKKPFTYTPGGIDLSQIKSQRMAKRLARNAQSEGATGQQQMHRPTQPPPQQNNGGPVASHLGATAMGMPFQVLPAGPPPPPPQPGKASGGAPPPPPPAPQQNKLAAQPNGSAARRSPTPQKFEPPPMGFRPEIKIPPNPMASLKKVPPPQEKNNFWVEEYRKERSKSPMVGNDENDNNRSSPNNPQPETSQFSYNNNSNQQNDYQRAAQSPQPMRQQQQQQEFYNQKQPSPSRSPVQQQQQQLDQQRRNESPYQTQYSSQQQSPAIQRQTSQYASPQYQQQNSPQQQQQQSPTMQRQISQQYSPQPQQQSPTIQRQPSQQYQNSPQHSPQVQRQQSIPTQSQQQQQQQYNSPQQSPSIQRQQQPQQQSPTSPQYQQQQQQQTSPTQQQSVPWRQQKQVPLTAQNNVTRPRDVMSPAPAELPRSQFQGQQQQQQQQYPAYLRSREALSPAPEQQQHSPQMSQPYQQKNAQVGSIYIPPVVNQQQQQQQQQFSPYQDSQGPRPQQQQQQQQQQAPRQAPTNRWMNAQGQPVENQTLSRVKSPPPPQSSPTAVNSSNGFGGNNAGLRLQINNTSSNAKERIIPIQLEQTPTPTRTPASAPGFGPQPFYNSAQQQQYSSVPSPPVNQGTPNNGQNSPNYIIRSPNQFVDQGYNQYTGVQDHPARVTSPPVQQQQQQQQSRIIQQTSTAGGVMTRIIPIAIESQPDGPLNPNNARGPISQQPIVIQNDPRNQNTWGSGSATPTQSKSFRILQKITDTSDNSALENKAIESDGGQEPEPQLQRPTYARQMTSTGQINSPNAEQMKRMQLNNEQAYANRARNQEEDKKSAGEEDPRYRGPSNPSKTFQKLQGAVERCSPCRTDSNGTPPVMKQPQPNRYVSQRPVYSPDDHSQQYVHPSEQQVPEPKIYTGSAIPSRSFKILQAMTTPENAGPGQSDL